MGLKANQLNPSPKLTGVINRAESLQQTKEWQSELGTFHKSDTMGGSKNSQQRDEYENQ
jgi:hypothetical protein